MDKIYRFLLEGVKRFVIDGFLIAEYFFKFSYFVERNQVPKFKEYSQKSFDLEEVKLCKPLKDSILERAQGSFICTFFITKAFIHTYLNDPQSNPTYDLLFDRSARNNILIGLREEPMGT